MKRAFAVAALVPGALALLLLPLALQAQTVKTRWVRVHDGVSSHVRLVNRYGNVLGEYYQMEPGAFVAACYSGAGAEQVQGVRSEASAKQYVRACEAWQ